MIISMTGYGHGEAGSHAFTVAVDISSLNGRYCDIGLRLPKVLQSSEQAARKKIQEQLARGKISVTVNHSGENDQQLAKLAVNVPKLKEYARLFAEIQSELGLESSPQLANYLTIHDVIQVEDEDNSVLLNELFLAALNEALAAADSMRRAEGKNLGADITQRLGTLGSIMNSIIILADKNAATALDEYRERIQKLLGDISVNDERLYQEIAILSDKRDITEECTRFASHLNLCASYIADDQPSGKRLGFILQELGRETNTIGSKTSNIEISHLVVHLKDQLEKIREQVHNIL